MSEGVLQGKRHYSPHPPNSTLGRKHAKNAEDRDKNGGNGETERKAEVKVKKKGADYIPLLYSM